MGKRSHLGIQGSLSPSQQVVQGRPRSSLLICFVQIHDAPQWVSCEKQLATLFFVNHREPRLRGPVGSSHCHQANGEREEGGAEQKPTDLTTAGLFTETGCGERLFRVRQSARVTRAPYPVLHQG